MNDFQVEHFSDATARSKVKGEYVVVAVRNLRGEVGFQVEGEVKRNFKTGQSQAHVERVIHATKSNT